MSEDEKTIDRMLDFIKGELAATAAKNEERRAKEDMTFARVRIATELLRRGGDPTMCIDTAKVLAEELLKP